MFPCYCYYSMNVNIYHKHKDIIITTFIIASRAYLQHIVQPKGFVDPKDANKVCKLQRSIYGLKQASRSWNQRFDKVIKSFGFIQTYGEACIYKKVSGSSVAFLILYVDDILLIGNDVDLLNSVKEYLNNSFSMKDLGEAAYILGIKI